MPVHENSLANLQPFRRGDDPRRRVGARSLGATITEWLNVLGDENDDGTAKYDEDALTAISQDTRAAPGKRYAASTMLRAYKGDWCKHIPLAANDLDRIFDRTWGKPHQTIEVQRGPEHTKAELLARIAALIDKHPEVRAAIGSRVDGVIDTEAGEVGGPRTGLT